MKENPSDYRGFEQGPIRPPSEAGSLLLRLTRNCPWNRCTFCSVYKKRSFSLRPVEEILRDIDTVHRYVGEIEAGGTPLRRGGEPLDERAWHAARQWVAGGMESVFLQDADSLAMPPEETIRVLRHIRERFPTIRRITSYARSQTVARIPEAQLKAMAEAGLNRIHIGMETASNRLLGMVRKGASKAVHIKAGVKVKEAGIELSEYVLAGIGGEEFWRDHALQSAEALSRIDPDFIRFRTLHILDSLDLYENSQGFDWRRPTDLTIAREIELFLENLSGITSTVKSDHMYNLFQEIDGKLPGDRERLLEVPRRFIAMDPERRASYQLGKRMGHFWRLADLEIPGRLAAVEEVKARAGITAQNVDERINEMLQERMRMGVI